MLCFLCGKKIRFLRSLVDQQYCCSEHRKEARLASAQMVREEEDVEPWAVARSREKAKNQKRPATSAGQTASIFAFLTVGGLLVAALLLPGPEPGRALPNVSLDPSIKRGLLARAGDAIGELVRNSGPVTLRETFGGAGASELADWADVNLRSGRIDDPRDWMGGTRRLASLRLWKRSVDLQNYQLEFEAEMQRNSLSWAFRADENAQNYYATKLAIIRPGPLPNAGVIRYTVIDGQESDLVQMPLPVTLDRGSSYRLRVTVQDNRFITYLDGRVISNWTDDRLTRGGVGFFDDTADPQKVQWVSLSERDSLLGRMLAHFSLIVVPGQPTAFR